MLAQSAYDLLALAVLNLPDQFAEREVHDIVMVQFLGGDFVAEFQPNAVQEVDFRPRQVRGVRAEIEDVFLPAGRVDLQD